MILAAAGLAGGIGRERRRRGLLARRQPLGHGLLNRMVDWWPLSEQSSQRRGLHGGLLLTDNATVTGGDGVDSLASAFTAANAEYLSRASETALQMGNADRTWVFWVNPTTLSGFPIIASKGWANTKTTNSEFAVYINGASGITFAVCAGTTQYTLSSDVTLSAGSFYLISVYHDATNDLLGLWINGTLKTTAHSDGVNAGTAQLEIGASTSQSLYWNGRIQRVGLWQRVLTSDELTWLYNSGRGRGYPLA